MNDYRRVMHASIRDGAWEIALALWFEFRNREDSSTPSSSLYAAALRACGGLGRWETAHAILGEMRAAGDGHAPQERHYSLAAGAAAVADELAAESFHVGALPAASGSESGRNVPSGAGSALSTLLDEMSAEGVHLGWETYAEVCWGRVQHGQWHRASDGVLELMREHGVALVDADGFSRARPALSSLLCAVNVYAYPNKEPSRTSRSTPGLGGQSKPPHPDGIRGLYCRLLTAASQIRMKHMRDLYEAAREVIRDILADAEQRLAPVGGVGPQLLAVAACSFYRAADWKGAREIALRLVAERGRCAAAHEEDANDLVAADVSWAMETALGAAVAACARFGQLEEAESLADHARAVAAEAIPPISPDGEIDTAGSWPSPEGGEHHAPLLAPVLDLALGSGLNVAGCVALADAYERAGRVSNAEMLRQRLKWGVAANLGVRIAAEKGGGVETELESYRELQDIDHKEGKTMTSTRTTLAAQMPRNGPEVAGATSVTLSCDGCVGTTETPS